MRFGRLGRSPLRPEGVCALPFWEKDVTPCRCHVRFFYPLIPPPLSLHPCNRYKYHLALIVVVDNENRTQIVMQALLSNEQTESFVFTFDAFNDLIEGGSVQVKPPPMCC